MERSRGIVQVIAYASIASAAYRAQSKRSDVDSCGVLHRIDIYQASPSPMWFPALAKYCQLSTNENYLYP